jgi:hypothetical protein
VENFLTNIEMAHEIVNGHDLMCEIVSSNVFLLEPECDEPTVRIQNAFVLNGTGGLASFDFAEHGDDVGFVYLYGSILSWNGVGPSRLIGGLRVLEW